MGNGIELGKFEGNRLGHFACTWGSNIERARFSAMLSALLKPDIVILVPSNPIPRCS